MGFWSLLGSVSASADVMQGAVYSTAQTASQSFLRILNTSSAPGKVTVRIADSVSGQVIGTWTSGQIPPNAAPQFSVSTLETAAPAGFTKPPQYAVTVESEFAGYLQHVLWHPKDGTITNLTTCNSGTTTNTTMLNNVHASTLDVGYPSSVIVSNTGAESKSMTLGIYGALDGARLGTYSTPIVAAGGQVILPMKTLEAAAQIEPGSAGAHYVLKAEGAFTGYLQHLVNNLEATVITDMTTVCALDGAPAPPVTSPVRQDMVFSSAQPGSQSFLRFFNTGPKTGTVTVMLRNGNTGQPVGQWSAEVPAGAAPQVSIAAMERNAAQPFIKPDHYSVSVQSSMTGYLQHVLWHPADGTITNLSTCNTGVTTNRDKLNNVHASTLDFGYPSSVIVTNTGTATKSMTLAIYDARDGARIGTYATPAIPRGGQVILAVKAIEAAAGITPGAFGAHYVIAAQRPFTGHLQHIVNNIAAAVITDMTTVCAITGSPLTINAGGTYTGFWESTDPNRASVVVNTAEPVILENCLIRGRGDLIQALRSGGNITVRGCHAYGLDPVVNNRQRGDFLHAYQQSNVVVQNNHIEGTYHGVLAQELQGATLTIRYNKARNLDGAASDGKGGRKLPLGYNPYGGDLFNHFALLDKARNLLGAEIAWNEIVNDDPYSATIGDAINLAKSSGTAASPIQVHNNYVYGGYGFDPALNTQYSGAGFTTDGARDDTAQTATAYVKVHHNQFVNLANNGAAIAAGHDIEIYSNRAVSTGLLGDSQSMTSVFGNAFGVYNNYAQSASAFRNNVVRDNVAGWMMAPYTEANPPLRGALRRSDYYLPGCEGGASGASSLCTNNVSLTGSITAATETAETTSWRQKVAQNGITLGPPP